MSEHAPNLGFEYEVHLPAYFALVLNNNPDIEDFSLQSNVEGFGNLDDLLVQIKKKNGEELRFAFQLKHKKDSHKHLLPSNLEAKGDFNIEKYCFAFKNLKEENKRYNFILFTNKQFNVKRVEEAANFKIKKDDRCSGKTFFDTSQNCGTLYKFEVTDKTEDGECVTKEDYRKFFSKFTLYTGQANFSYLDRNLHSLLEFKEVCLKYIDFFRRWHRKEFSNKILDKKTLNIQLIDIFLAPYIMESAELPSKNFEQAVKEFDVTILENVSSDLFSKTEEEEEDEQVKHDTFIQQAKECKIIDRSSKQIDKSVKLKLLYYIFEKPMIIIVTETFKNLIYKAMEMYRVKENKIKFVFVGQQIDSTKFGNLRIFQNLQILSTVNRRLYDEITNECVLSFQGRIKMSLKKLFEDYGNFANITSPTDLLQMLHEDYLVGGKKVNIPSYYMPRSISIKIQKLETILRRCVDTKELIIIFTNGFQNFRSLSTQEVTILSVQDFRDKIYITGSAIVLTTDEPISPDFFDQISKMYYRKCKKLYSKKNSNEKPAAHYFMLLNEEDLLLVKSNNNISSSLNPNLENLSVSEDNIDVYLRNSINVLVSGTGMGKSTLFKRLKNDSFRDWWTFYVDLKLHTDFLKKRPNGNQVLNYLMELEESTNPNSFTKKILKFFVEAKHVLIFLDGLDEIEVHSLNNVLDFATELSSMGYHTWLSSRLNLKQKLEQKFNIFAIEIEELNLNEQEMYIRERLQPKYQQEEIEKIIVNIFRNFDVVNNFQILGIPLQLFIITEILINDPKNFQHNEDIFVLTKLYRMFIEKRYSHVIEKTDCQNPRLLPLEDIEDLLEKYELLALHSMFPEEILSAIDFDTRKMTRTLTKYKEEKDPLGIVLEVNSEEKAVFEHATFAEYFACTFLANTYIKDERVKRFLFSEECENLLRMLNILLAEDSKLHLAVIYKDLDQIKAILDNNSPWCVDKGGRNLLHTLSCISTRYPHLKTTSEGEYIEIDDLPVKDLERESSVIAEILKLLLNLNVNWLVKDDFFSWDPLTYAANFGALYIVEALCERSFNDIMFVHTPENIIYYSFKFGYPHILFSKLFFGEWNLSFDKIICKSLSESVIQLVVQKACKNQHEIGIILCSDIISFSLLSAFRNINNIRAQDRARLIRSIGRLAMSTARQECRSISTSISNNPCYEEPPCSKARILRSENYVQKASTSFLRKPTLSLQKPNRLIKLLKNSLFRSKWLPPRMRTNSKLLFYHAALEGNVQIMFSLLDKKSKRDFRGIKHFSLFPAIENNQVAAVTLLLNIGASVNCVAGPLYETPLHLAARVGNVTISELLLYGGANLESKRGDGLNVLNSAIFENQNDVVNVLLERGANCDHQSLFAAAYAGNLQLLKHLVKTVGKINDKNEKGEHVLHYIFKNDDVNVDAVDFLLANGASIEERGKNGWTVLHYAVMSGQVEVVELLLKKYNLIEFLYVADNEGATPLQLAVQQGDVELVYMIMGQDIDIGKIKFNKKLTSLYKPKGCWTSDLLLQVSTEIRDMLD